MTPTASPPRDEVIDANHELSRKRARLNGDEGSQSPLSDGPIHIEALAPEQLGADADVIELDDDDEPVIEMPYSETFQIFDNDDDPVKQIRLLHKRILSARWYVDTDWIVTFGNWVCDHVEVTKELPEEVLLQRYMDEEMFFGELANMSTALLQRKELFEPGQVTKSFTISCQQMLFALVTLTGRVLNMLPMIMNDRLARRDSVQPPPRPNGRHIPALNFLRLAASLTTGTAKNLQNELGVRLADVFELSDEVLKRDAKTITRCYTVLIDLVPSAREVDGAWGFIDAALEFIDSTGDTATQERVVDMVNKTILPTICEKHPRALPIDHFHERVVNFCSRAIDTVSARLRGSDDEAYIQECGRLYESLVKSDQDALLIFKSTLAGHENGNSDSTRTANDLFAIAGGDLHLIPSLLRIAWTLQACKSYIFSSIMDVRSVGISLLSAKLGSYYHSHCQSTQHGAEHPVIQYAARFLRCNEMTKYIFSADSHASIITHSADIISFLAATHNYTDAETDIMWQSCTTSVEADFVKASFSVLQHVCRFLGPDLLLYLARRYLVSPVSSVSNQIATDTLQLVFRYIHESIIPGDSAQQLAPVLIALELIEHIHEQGYSAASYPLFQVAMNELSCASEYRVEDIHQLVERCAPYIREQSLHGTWSRGVVLMFMRSGYPSRSVGPARLLEMLPISVTIGELCRYIEDTAKAGVTHSNLFSMALSCRLELVIRLIDLASAPERGSQAASGTQSDEDSLFEFLFGALAINNDARDIAWSEMVRLGKDSDIANTVSRFLDRCLTSVATSLSPQHATPALVALIVEPLKKRIIADVLPDQYPEMLKFPLWTALLQIAVESSDMRAMNAALGAVCDMLFVWPQKHMSNKTAIVQCQVEFVRDFVDRLCTKFAELRHLESRGSIGGFKQALHVLMAVLVKSRDTQSSFQLPKPPNKIVLCEYLAPGQEFFCFSVQICGPNAQQELISVQASKTNTVADLVARLPEHTGADRNRLIVGGQMIDKEADADKQLCEAGIRASGVLMISPIYTFGCDFDKVLTSAGPAEQEIMQQYDRLAKFLDGPPQVADACFGFLCHFKPSITARRRIMSMDSSIADLFPADRPYRTAHSVGVLSVNLKDSARLGIADEDFILRGVHALTTVLLDGSRPFHAQLCLQIARCLREFLYGTPETGLIQGFSETDGVTEQPKNSLADRYFKQPMDFARAMITRIIQTVCLPSEPSGSDMTVRSALTTTLYELVILACRYDLAVWNAVAEDDRVHELHAKLLLDKDLVLNNEVAKLIKRACRGSPEDCVARYWQIAMPLLPNALLDAALSVSYFTLLVDLLSLHGTLTGDEAVVRELIAQLVAKLRKYNHVETFELAFTDQAALGLVRLLSAAITALKSFKKPLVLEGLSSELFVSLLFPPSSPQARPLLASESRAAVLEVVKAACDTVEDYRSLAIVAKDAMSHLQGSPDARFNGTEGWIRPPTACAGLSNLGMTCYMNSLLQQLFANLEFRHFIFTVPIVQSARQSFLEQVQQLFVRMQEDCSGFVSTVFLAQNLGIEINSQEDVHGFYATFLSNLEDSMPDQECKSTLKKFYSGTSVSQIKGDCGHVSAQTEIFNDLSITVKNKASLQESLDEYVQGEPMRGANKYKCMTCDAEGGGKLVDAMKRTCLETVPDHLTLLLKRFTYETMYGEDSKANDRFEFPQQIDMAAYQRQHLDSPDQPVDPDMFDLVGVIVHSGTLSFGHYWSYVRLRGPADAASWVCLEDTKCTPCKGIEEVQEKCFGGNILPNGEESVANAYVLLYQRRSNLEHQKTLARQLCTDPTVCAMLPPRVNVSDELAQPVHTNNLWRHGIAHLFSQQFASFVDWLVGSYPRTNDKVGSEDATKDSNHPDDADTIASLASPYLLRLLGCQHQQVAPKMLLSFRQALLPALGNHDGLVKHLLRLMVEDHAFFRWIWRNNSNNYRTTMSQLIEQTLLTSLRESDDPAYDEILRMIVNIHASLQPDLDAFYGKWDQYFAFAGAIAKVGAAECAMLLDYNYLLNALKLIHLPCLGDKREFPRVAGFLAGDSIDFSDVYNFVHDLLHDHVDLLCTGLNTGDQAHEVRNGLVVLHLPEATALQTRGRLRKAEVWLIAALGGQTCALTTDWDYYPPGRLVSLLAGPKVHDSFLPIIEEALVDRFHEEDTHIEALLLMTLHYCWARGEQCSKTLRTLAVNLNAWTPKTVIKDVLDFWQVAYKFAPLSTIEVAPEWIIPFLSVKNVKDGPTAKGWLEQHIFVDANSNSPQAAARVRTSRALADIILPTIRKAYETEERRSRYEALFDVMLMEMTWLDALHQDVTRALNDSEQLQGTPSSINQPGLMVEIEESRSTLKVLKETLGELADWESVPGEVGVADIRESVEANDSDAEAEEGFESSEFSDTPHD